MKKKGLANNQISQALKEKGYNPSQIEDALTQASIKQGVNNPSSNNPNQYVTPREAQDNSNFFSNESSSPSINVSPDTSNIPQEYESSSLDEDIPVPSPPEGEKEESSSFVGGFKQPTAQPQMPYQATSEELVEAIIDEKWQQLISNIGDIELWKSRVTDDIESVKQEILRINQKFETIQSTMIGRVSEYSQSLTTVNTEIKALEQVMQKIIEPLTTNIKELNRITQEMKRRNST